MFKIMTTPEILSPIVLQKSAIAIRKRTHRKIIMLRVALVLALFRFDQAEYRKLYCSGVAFGVALFLFDWADLVIFQEFRKNKKPL